MRLASFILSFLTGLIFFPGPHSLAVSAYYPAGQFTQPLTNLHGAGQQYNVTNHYYAAGYVTNRMFANSKTQTLTWDASGRLVGLTQWNNPTNGFFWTAIYDALGRRLRTVEVPVANGYGPVLGYQASTLTAGTPLADTLVWRSRGVDPSGYYNLGARYYDPLAGHFLSPDPLGHAASMDLYSFCAGDPINRFDPTGRFATGNTVGGLFELAGGIQDLHTAFTDAREEAREFDVAHEDQIDETLAVVDLSAVAFAVPIAAEGLLTEGLGAGAGLGLEEGEIGGIEGFNARSASWASSLEESEGAGLAEAGTIETEAAIPTLASVVDQTLAVEGNVIKSAVGETLQATATTTSETASIASQASQSLAESGGAVNETVADATSTKALVPYSGPTTSGWPGNRGFLSGPYSTELKPGTLIDRYGNRSGTFVSPKGTPFPQRGLPANYETEKPLETYEVLTPLKVNTGQVAPAFGQPGFGVQHELPFSVQELIDLGVLGPK